MRTLIHERVELARRGDDAKVISRLASGWVVMGDVQFLPGYSLLLPDPVVPSLESLPLAARVQYLSDMALVGEAVLQATGALRINYEILGNVEPALHAHVFPRYRHEPDELRAKPVWFYDWNAARPFNLEADRPMMDAIHSALVPLQS